MRIAVLHTPYRSGQLSGENTVVAQTADVRLVVSDWSGDKFEMWKQARYDILFTGDDWKTTKWGTGLERILGQIGASVHYFPYTVSTSSTDLRRLLEGMS